MSDPNEWTPAARRVAFIVGVAFYGVVIGGTFLLLAAFSAVGLHRWLPWWAAVPLGLVVGFGLFVAYDLATCWKPDWAMTGYVALRCVPLFFLLTFLALRCLHRIP